MSGRAPSSPSPWPSGSPGPRSSSRSLAARLGIFLLLLAVLTLGLFLVWPRVQPYYSAGVAHAANLLLAAEEMGQRVTTLRPEGGLIQVWSTLRDDGEPAETYDADVLHFYIVPATALVLAYPGLRVRARMRTLSATIAAFFVFHTFALLVVVEHTYAVILAEVARRNYTPGEAAVYTWLFQSFAYLAVQLAPAATLLALFLLRGGFVPGRTGGPAEAAAAARVPAVPPASPERVRARAGWRALAAAAAALAAAAGFAGWVHLGKVAARRSEDHCARGFKALQAGSPGEAARLFTLAAALKPEFLQAQDGLGNARQMAGDSAGAEAAFNEALRIDDAYLPSLMGLANALLTQGRTQEALSLYARAAERHAGRWETEYNLGMALVHAGRPEEAEPHLARAADLHPSMPDARFELAKILLTTRRACRALPHLEAFAALDPASPHADLVRRTIAALRPECGRRPER